MAENSSITIRRARRDDVGVIVAMLADDPLGSARANASKTRCRRRISTPSKRSPAISTSSLW